MEGARDGSQAALTVIDAVKFYTDANLFTLESPEPVYCGPKVFERCVGVLEMLSYGVPAKVRAQLSGGAVRSVKSVAPADLSSVVGPDASPDSVYEVHPMRGVGLELVNSFRRVVVLGGSISYGRLLAYMRAYRVSPLKVAAVFPGGAPPGGSGVAHALFFSPVNVPPLPDELRYAVSLASRLEAQ